MIVWRRFLLLFVTVFGITLKPFAQSTIGLPLIVNYSKAEFKGGSQTWDIKQDSRGIMYFANNEGLMTYDGSYWKIYPLPNKTIIRSLYIDPEDKIYVGGQGEIGFFTPGNNGALEYTSLKNKIPVRSRKFDDIWNIAAMGESLFFRCLDKIFELRNNTVYVHEPFSDWQFLGEAGKQVFAQDRNNGLFRFSENKWIPACDKKKLTGIYISGIIQAGPGSLLVTTRNSNCFILHNGTLANCSLQGISNEISNSAKINDSVFVVGTPNDGCSSFGLKKGLIQRISRTEGLQNNYVNCVFVDREKNIWAGVNNGISFIPYNSPIKYIQPNTSSELAGYSSRIFDGKLYIGTSNGIYAIPLSPSGSDISFDKREPQFVKNSGGAETWRLDEVNQQLLASQTAGSSVIRGNECFPIALNPGSWLSIPLTSVYPAQNILVGTFTGLRILHFEQNQFTNAGMSDGPQDSYRYVVIDNNGDIWASHPYRGVYRLRFSSDLKHYTAQLFTSKDGLPSTLRNHVFKIKNTIVFATEKGVYEFDAGKNKFVHSPFLWPVFDTLEMRYLNEDIKGNIWFCSGKRIGVVNYKEGGDKNSFSTIYFTELTGKILSGFENVYPYNDENIFISSETGIIHLNYKKYVSDRVKLNVVLSNVVAIDGNNNKPIYGGYDSAQEDKPVKLPSSLNAFHFEFSSPAFGFQGTIEYRYQLVGYDAGWSAWSAKREKDYTNLHHGSYAFKVQARDNLRNESGIITYYFTIKAPWYISWWAKALYFLVAGFVVYSLYKWQQKKMYLQQQKYEAEQKRLQYILQLEREKNEKEIIKLQNEKLASEVMLKKKELANTSMKLAGNAEAFARIKEELNRVSYGSNQDIKKIATLLKVVEDNNTHWDQFASHFDEVNDGFLKKIKAKYPYLSNSDLKMCAYLRLNLSSKEIAQLLNISVRGVEISRYRLRKKLQLQTEQSLTDFLRTVELS